MTLVSQRAQSRDAQIRHKPQVVSPALERDGDQRQLLPCALQLSRFTVLDLELLTRPLVQWLDEGEGKDLDLEQCPRNQLESERIKYLNAEEREVYRVKVNEAGLLVWAKDGTLLDTSKLHEDRGPDKGGIVAVTEEEYEEKRRKEEEKLRKMQAEGKKVNMSSSSSSSSSSSDEADEIREGVRAYGDKVRLSSVHLKLHELTLCCFLQTAGTVRAARRARAKEFGRPKSESATTFHLVTSGIVCFARRSTRIRELTLSAHMLVFPLHPGARHLSTLTGSSPSTTDGSAMLERVDGSTSRIST